MRSRVISKVKGVFHSQRPFAMIAHTGTHAPSGAGGVFLAAMVLAGLGGCSTTADGSGSDGGQSTGPSTTGGSDAGVDSTTDSGGAATSSTGSSDGGGGASTGAASGSTAPGDGSTSLDASTSGAPDASDSSAEAGRIDASMTDAATGSLDSPSSTTGSTGDGQAGADGGTGVDGAGGTTSGCGAVGQACCAAPAESCGADLTCLAGASCSCVKGTFGSYVIRVDGIVLQEPTTATGAQTAVLDAATAQPLTGAVNGYDGAIAGGGVGCMVRDDGTVWCWRSTANGNSVGALGNGTTDTSGPTFRATQVLVSANTPLTNVKSIDLLSPCAVTNDGKLYCWGDVSWLVNNGTSLASPYAQPITTDGATPLSGVLQVSAAGRSPCAVVAGTSANEVWCWGDNLRSSLGTGDTTNRHYPTKIAGFTNPTKVVGSFGTSPYSLTAHCAIDGANVLCWGYNGDGETGTGNSNTPVTVPTLVKIADGTTPFTQPVDLYAGFTRICALRAGGTLWCWGSGYHNYADNIGVSNVVAAGNVESLRYLTSDGVYHANTVAVSPNCGSLQ
jgi:hypothetical protein